MGTPAPAERVYSIDAYRGFVMLAMISAGLGTKALAQADHGWKWLADQCEPLADVKPQPVGKQDAVSAVGRDSLLLSHHRQGLRRHALLEMPCGVFQPRQVHASHGLVDGSGVFRTLYAGKRPHGPVVGEIPAVGVEHGHRVGGIAPQRHGRPLGKQRQVLHGVGQGTHA